MKNILLPTDFSNNSINAIDYAMKLFTGELCTFFLLNVQKTSRYISDDLMAAPINASVHQSIISDTKKKLDELLENLEDLCQNEQYTFHTINDYDVLIDSIKQAIQAKNIDLIIMGTNGATGASEVVFGSNTLNVIRKVDCPLLVIPQGFRFSSPKNILYAIDRNDRFYPQEIDPLTDIIAKFKPSLRILKIKEDDTITIAEFDDKKHIKEFLGNCNHSFHAIINIPTVEAINSFVQIMDIDMTAIFIKRETFLERFLKGSETSKISYGTRVPLLVMYNHE